MRGRHGPESRWAAGLLAQRVTEHRAEAEVTVEARLVTFTQAAGLLLWNNKDGVRQVAVVDDVPVDRPVTSRWTGRWTGRWAARWRWG
ncbi:beta-xylosidase family glycoside hydrolase [Streptomyces massasporeus]|uniref:beta-xylosidase family glycoside hydrolase n=1 Tax=Streptomyces massasporeus TaxID=67324 RepID=UPI003667B107